MKPHHQSWSNLKIGIVVLIGLVIFVFMISTVGTEQNLFSSNYTLKLFLPNVQGLVNGVWHDVAELDGIDVTHVTVSDLARL